MRLRWLRRAMTDRDAQLDYIAQDSPAAALAQGQHIAEQVRQLPRHPEIGREGRLPGTREWVIQHTPFIAVYRIRGEHIEILRILHGAQQWPPLAD